MKQQQQQPQYSLQGPDPTVSWESVQMVLYRCVVASPNDDDEERCPICLDVYTCPRITKCGHVFCYPCLLHHMQSYSESHPYAKEAPKCPCCALGVHLEDVRPVHIQSLLSMTTTIGTHPTFVKLHRVKNCPAPYLPLPDCPRRSSPHAVPCQTDVDAQYSKFLYVDPRVYQSHLTFHLQELQQQQQLSDSYYFSRLAQDRVQVELQQALSHMDAEVQLMQQFANPTAGIYQGHPPCFLYVPSALAEAPPPILEDGRTRGESIGSESYQSVGEDSTTTGGAEESSSVTKNDSPSKAAKNKKGHKHHKNSKPLTIQASMFLDPEEETMLYQAQDGSLCFLSAFNMKCLRAEFSVSLPENHKQPPSSRKIMPLPDQIQGKVVEIEKVHLTPALRSRIRCLSHLPLYMDICFVELDLKHLLSASTKKLFAKEFQARQRSRQKKLIQEQQEQTLANQREQERIDRLKSMMIPHIDPDDPFFQPVLVSPPVEEEVVTILGDDFGPSLGGGEGGTSSEVLVSASPPTTSRRTTTATISFSQITREGGAFPSFSPQRSSEEDFPSLSSSAFPPPSAAAVKPRLEPPGAVTPSGGGTKKKKTKGSKKILLFSTDSHRTAF